MATITETKNGKYLKKADANSYIHYQFDTNDKIVYLSDKIDGADGSGAAYAKDATLHETLCALYTLASKGGQASTDLAALSALVEGHLNNTNNPHKVDKVDVKLGSVVNAPMDDAPTKNSPNYVTSGGVYTALQNYEKKMSFTSVSSLPTTCVVNTYYRITSSKTSLAVTLPSSSLTAGDTIGISFTAGSSITTPTVSGGTIYKQDGWSDFFEANATYEIVALYDGGKWLVTSTKFKS